jgi:hypothetical protein
MTLAMWLISLWATLIPLLGLAFRRLELRRDTFFLLVYLQTLAYVDFAPILASTDLNAATVDRYAWVQFWALVLFQLPLTIIYAVVIRRRRPIVPEGRVFALSPVRLTVFAVGSVLFGVAYTVVAVEYGLIYRRLGEDLSKIQMSMNIIDFAIYRAFIELGPFLMSVQLLLLRTQPTMSRQLRAWAWAGLLSTSVLYMSFAMINTRLTALMTLVTMYGIVNVTSRGTRRFSLGAAMGALVVAVGGFYAVRVVGNVRLSVGRGESIFALSNFLPVASQEGQLDDTLRWRMNGVDLIAMIADNVEAQGPALGGAWAVPFVLSLDPIVRTPFTVAAKTANLTSAKSWLMLRYSGVGKTDYYSCMLTDVYGNFSIYGFLLPALLLGIVLARATAALRWSAKPAGVVFAAFAITRVLPFEQEFESLLFGWYKLLPFVLVALLFYPLRRRRHAAIPAQTGPLPASS